MEYIVSSQNSCRGEICFENNPDSYFKAGIRRDQVIISLYAAFDVFDDKLVFGYIMNHDC